VEYFCHFHPTSPARWRCSKCQRYYDHACTATSQSNAVNSGTTPCPACNAPLLLLANESSQDTSPALFSGQLVSSPVLLMICSLVLVAAISSFASLPPSVLLALNQAAVLFICFHYGRQLAFAKVFSSGRRHSKNRHKSLRPAIDADTADLRSSLQCAFGFGLLYLLPVVIFYQVHWLAGLLLIFGASLLTPYLLIFTLHQFDEQRNIELKKLFSALDPFKLSLLLQSLILYIGSILISDFGFQHSPLWVALMLSSALACLALLMLFHSHAQAYQLLMQKLNAPAITPEKAVNPLFSGQNQTEKTPLSSNEIDLALKMGQYPKAVALLEQALKRNTQSVLRRQQLYLLLSELNDIEKLSRYAEIFLNWMLERGKIREASQFLYRIRKQDPAFRIHNIELMTELAKQFTRQKKYALVLWLAEGSDKRFKPSEALASLHLSASQVLITHFQDLAKAEDYLLFVGKQCAEFPSAEAAKALLIHVQNTQLREQKLRE